MSHIRSLRFIALGAVLSAIPGFANASWIDVCPPPPSTDRFSTDWNMVGLGNELMTVAMGTSGTSAWASTDDLGCFASAVTGNVRGRIGFGIGTSGSVQTSTDDLMAITWGYGYALSGGRTIGVGSVFGAFSYATVQEDTTSTLFGANGFQTAFVGASDSYFFARTTNGNVQIDLRADLVGDAARLDWTLRNVDATNAHAIGLRFGQNVALLPATLAGGLPATTYVTAPGLKPLRVEQRFTRSTDPSGFPATIDFGFTQANAIGLRVQNTADDATTDNSDATGSQTSVDSFVFGRPGPLLGVVTGGDVNTFPDAIQFEPISDTIANADPAFIQTWAPTSVLAGGSRRIVSFYRSTWSDAVYSRPYSIVADTPKVVNLDAANSGQFSNNPFTLRVWVDNNRGFSTIDTELPLQDVRVELLLPTGLTAVGGTVRTIPRVDARRMQSVDFQVAVDNFTAGDVTYQVRVTPTPGPQKTITGQIKVVSQPKLRIRQNANLVTAPWTFTSPTWETILGLQPDLDYQAFTYDPVRKEYIVTSGPTRGKADWIIAKNEADITLGGTPTAPTDGVPQPDGTGGAPLITLKPGWNLIGNPYHVSIQLGQIVGSAASNSSGAFTFNQLVQQGIVSGSLAYWDPDTATYKFIQKLTDSLEPQKGYWIYVYSAQDVVFRYPSIFTPFARSYKADTPAWQQNDRQYRLQLAARTNTVADDNNFIGVSSSSDVAKAYTVVEPPMTPTKEGVSLSVTRSVNGKDMSLAQAISDKPGKQNFDVTVTSKQSGPVTLTWPNLNTLPKSVRVRLTDKATGEVRDLRKVSGYRFDATGSLTREFKIEMETGVASRATIGNVVVSRSGRAGGADAAIRLSYSLTTGATTTVRILGGTGREVMTITRGRADNAGTNEVVWNLRDQANRSVPPGTYRAEIIAEGDDGERVRKVVPILVTR